MDYRQVLDKLNKCAQSGHSERVMHLLEESEDAKTVFTDVVLDERSDGNVLFWVSIWIDLFNSKSSNIFSSDELFSMRYVLVGKLIEHRFVRANHDVQRLCDGIACLLHTVPHEGAYYSHLLYVCTLCSNDDDCALIVRNHLLYKASWSLDSESALSYLKYTSGGEENMSSGTIVLRRCIKCGRANLASCFVEALHQHLSVSEYTVLEQQFLLDFALFNEYGILRQWAELYSPAGVGKSNVTRGCVQAGWSKEQIFDALALLKKYNLIQTYYEHKAIKQVNDVPHDVLLWFARNGFIDPQTHVGCWLSQDFWLSVAHIAPGMLQPISNLHEVLSDDKLLPFIVAGNTVSADTLLLCLEKVYNADCAGRKKDCNDMLYSALNALSLVLRQQKLSTQGNSAVWHKILTIMQNYILTDESVELCKHCTPLLKKRGVHSTVQELVDHQFHPHYSMWIAILASVSLAALMALYQDNK